MKTNMKKMGFSLFGAILLLSLSLSFSGCQTGPDKEADIHGFTHEWSDDKAPVTSQSQVLNEGDVVNIEFLGAPDLNSVQKIRRDGKISVQLIGEMVAAGKTPTELEKEIIKLAGPQLVAKEVMVTVNTAAFPIFVTGAVLRPGKITADRPLSALQAIMEAGGFDYGKANLKSVRVLRQEGDELKNYKINLKLPLQGKKSDPFQLKPEDIIFVPEKFVWF